MPAGEHLQWRRGLASQSIHILYAFANFTEAPLRPWTVTLGNTVLGNKEVAQAFIHT